MQALAINTNVPSITGRRHLIETANDLTQALERLSSGLRINRAADDAAGLAISTLLQTQTRGLQQAIRNSNDGISVIQTAEGALNTYVEICQRIRELAVQSSSETASVDNRRALQVEVDQQVFELRRIADTMQWNGINLFDGTFINRRILADFQAGNYFLMSVPDMGVDKIGRVAEAIGAPVGLNALQDGNIAINGFDVPYSVSDSALDKANAINSIYYETKVFARAERPELTGTYDAGSGAGVITAGTLDSTDRISINGVAIPIEGSISVEAGDTSGALREAINEVSPDTGVEASVDDSGRLVLEALEAESFTYQIATTAARDIVALTDVVGSDVTVNGRLRLYGDQGFIVSAGSNPPVGPITVDSLIGVSGEVGYDSLTAVENVNVSSFESSQNSIIMIDNALRQIIDIRARLGALTNRIEGTIDNLSISAENLLASDSRIRDADFASETAAMVRAQILQQSGVAVLAQANVMPQAAISLIGG